MNRSERLKRHHPEYQERKEVWKRCAAAYEGADAVVSAGFIERHERESQRNYRRRLARMYSFNLSATVVDLLQHYLLRPKASRDFGSLANQKRWSWFMDDCDLNKNDFDAFMALMALWSSIHGHAGVLVDRANRKFNTLADEIAAVDYPYVSLYPAPNILDWEWSRAHKGRRSLEYLKLLDQDGLLRLWWPEKWEIHEPDPKADGGYRLLEQGENPLGEIPFVWNYNVKRHNGDTGKSDIEDISRIDISIMENLSQGEEVMDLAGFPMMRKAMRRAGEQSNNDETGPSAILEFDPNLGESGKPDWLKAEVASCLSACMEWIEFKAKNIQRMAHVSGTGINQDTSTVASGVSLKVRFQLLNAKLAHKGANLAETERKIIDYWLRWVQQGNLYEAVSVSRPEEYDVEDLDADLRAATQAKILVGSRMFQAHLEKGVARRFLDGATEDERQEILKDVEKTALAAPSSERNSGVDSRFPDRSRGTDKEDDDPGEGGGDSA